MSKERLTLLLGGNAARDFKLKPLLVYLSENPRPLKGVNKNKLPVIWRSTKKAWMTKFLFEDWFKNYFCPEVKKYLKLNNFSNKALLLLNNAQVIQLIYPNYLKMWRFSIFRKIQPPLFSQWTRVQLPRLRHIIYAELFDNL